MKLDTLTIERIQRANDMYDDLIRLNRSFISHVREYKWKYIFSRHVITVPLLLSQITRFEDNGVKLLTEMGITDNDRHVHELLCEFKDVLNDFRSAFVEYMNLARLNPAEDSSELFDIYTYGGHV